MTTIYRLYIVSDRITLEETLVWAYSQAMAIKIVTEHQYTASTVSQRELCRMVASGINPINEPPDDK